MYKYLFSVYNISSYVHLSVYLIGPPWTRGLMCNTFNFQEKFCKLVYCIYFTHNNIFLHIKYKHNITICQIKTGFVDPAELTHGPRWKQAELTSFHFTPHCCNPCYFGTKTQHCSAYLSQI